MTDLSYYARGAGVPVDLVKAIVQVESSGNPWAMRYEPHYRWLYDVENRCAWVGDEPFPALRGVSSPTEKIAQATSWGLMQIMGAVAREMGYRKPFLGELLRPSENLEMGCEYLKQLYRRFGSEHGWEGVAAAYNAGSPRRKEDGTWENQQYLDRLREAGWT